MIVGYLPDDFDPSSVDKATERDIDVLNEEMEAAGVEVFRGGLSPASEAKSLRAQLDGKVLVTDGPTWRPRSTLAVSRWWKPLTWTRRWRGHARPP